MTDRFACGGCEITWTGATRCHCGGCHMTFTSLSAFDHHRTYDKCRPPAERGLQEHDGLWSLPPS